MARGRVKIDLQNENIVRSIGKALNALRNFTSFGMVENMNELLSKSLEVSDLVENEHGETSPTSAEYLHFWQAHKDELSDKRFQSLISDAFVAERKSSSIASIRRQGELVKAVRERDTEASASLAILEVLKELKGHSPDIIDKKVKELFGEDLAELSSLLTKLSIEINKHEADIYKKFIARLNHE
jgi:hypothetical protein